MTRPRVYINGKFYVGPINGVHRVADRLLRHVDALAAAGGAPASWDIRLLVPERDNWAPDFQHMRKMPQRGGHTQVWEQLILPIAARDGILVSLANFGPVLHPRKITMVHDAQFRLSPKSYTPKRRWGYRLLIPAGARTSRIVLTVSDYAKDSLEMFRFASRDRIVVVHNAAEHILEVAPDQTILDRLQLKPRGYCLLFGSVAAYKNVQVIFDAFRSRQLGALTLVVVGPDEAKLRQHGLLPPDVAIYAGGVDDASLRALYEGALCLLFPSRTEGFGLPPLEAMSCGCPVISAPAGAMPEVCRDAASYANDEAESWVSEISSIMKDQGRREGKRQAGFARAAAFSWNRSAARLVDAIAVVAASR